MPEIPHLNIFSVNLSKRLLGQTLTQINIIVPKKLKVPKSLLKDALEDKI
jgi:formamidopyrimidine-DNA glycosylase